MNTYKTISDYKAQAKEQLLGNYGLTVGSFVLLFAIIYTIGMTIMGANVAADSARYIQSMSNGEAIAQIGTGRQIWSEVIQVAISAVVEIFYELLFVGYISIIRNVSYGRRAKASDIFYSFKNHPDKVIIMSLIMVAIRLVLFLPSTVLQYYVFDSTSGSILSGKRFLLWIVLYCLAAAAVVIVNLAFVMRHFIYLDDCEASVADYFKKSYAMMKGHMFRCFYIQLSLIGYWLLSLLSLGVGSFFVNAYKNMIICNMYRDLKGEDIMREVAGEEYVAQYSNSELE